MVTRPPHRHRGFSLVELMIAITLGLLVVAAVSSIYLSSSRSYRTQGAVSQVQEEGRFANLLVVPIVRLAGYLPDPLNQPDPTSLYVAANSKLAIWGTDNSAPASNKYAGFDPTKVVAGTDVLVLSYIGKTTTTPADSPLRTCLGENITDATQMAVNIFYISTDGNGTNSLSCATIRSNIADNANLASNTTNNQPLVAGVTDMQVLYGIDTDNDFDSNRYLTANNVTDWTTVSSVKITFTVDSIDATEGGATGNDIANGGRIRHSFNTTIQIRNRLHA